MYSPKIDEELIPELYRIARERKLPMTRLVNGLIRERITEYQASETNEKQSKTCAADTKGG